VLACLVSKSRHRGPHPLDQKLFCPQTHEALRSATRDLSWLLGRAYPVVAALKIVGDKHGLESRQRLAVRRSACSDDESESRLGKRIPLNEVRDRPLVIDGFNCIITLESAFSGGALFRGRDGAFRDLASVHGSYRRVDETRRALASLHDVIGKATPSSVTWYLDRPVSNSGRLAGMIREVAPDHDVELVFNPDRTLVQDTSWVVASSDAWVLDQCTTWFDLTGAALEAVSEPWCIDLALS